ncbi:MAG: hypothetical protein ACYTAN_02790, partial [Planctomycetota bacterium]
KAGRLKSTRLYVNPNATESHAKFIWLPDEDFTHCLRTPACWSVPAFRQASQFGHDPLTVHRSLTGMVQDVNLPESEQDLAQEWGRLLPPITSSVVGSRSNVKPYCAE